MHKARKNIFSQLCVLWYFSQVMVMLLFPVQLLAVAATVYLELVRSAQGGAYYGIKQLPPQVPQYQPLGQQVPHMPLGKEGIPMQHLGKEVPHMPYGKEYPHLPQYRKEVPQMPMLGKDMVPKKEKGRSACPSPLLHRPVRCARALLAMGKLNVGAGCCRQVTAPCAQRTGHRWTKQVHGSCGAAQGHQHKTAVILWAAAQPLSSPTCNEPPAHRAAHVLFNSRKNLVFPPVCRRL